MFSQYQRQPLSSRKVVITILILLCNWVAHLSAANADLLLCSSKVASSVYYARAGRIQVAKKFLSEGNRDGKMYTQYLFEDSSYALPHTDRCLL